LGKKIGAALLVAGFWGGLAGDVLGYGAFCFGVSLIGHWEEAVVCQVPQGLGGGVVNYFDQKLDGIRIAGLGRLLEGCYGRGI
jgi:hypothetical protein